MRAQNPEATVPALEDPIVVLVDVRKDPMLDSTEVCQALRGIGNSRPTRNTLRHSAAKNTDP